MINKQELNKKLAEFGGIRPATQQEYQGHLDIIPQPDMEKRGWGWHYPNGVVKWYLPNFTQSLDACSKWLVPEAKKRDINLRIVLSTQGLLTTVEIFGSHPFDDDYPTKKLAWAMDEEPALALCLAIEKLIDELP